MASWILARSKALPLAAALTRGAAYAAPPIAGARALSSLPRYPSAPSSHGLGKVRKPFFFLKQTRGRGKLD